MRKIKFRAWNVENQEMIDADSLAFDYYEPLCDQLRDSDEMKFMQFTGLTDKNGVEIYEGDILETDLSRPYLLVEFRGGAFMYQCHDSGNDYYDFMSPSDEPRDQDNYCAVIGNKHQNPDLLEGEQ